MLLRTMMACALLLAMGFGLCDVVYAGEYTFTKIKVRSQILPPVLSALNNAGAVTGYFYRNNRFPGFIYQDGVVTDFVCHDKGPVPSSINDKNTVVGYYADAAGNRHGFIYKNGKCKTLDNPAGPNTMLTGINNSGVIVGYYYTHIDQPNTGFIYRNGVFDTGALRNKVGLSLTPQAINNRGNVAATCYCGYQGRLLAYLFKDGHLYRIQPKSGGTTQALAMNDYGDVVGWSESPSGAMPGFYYRRGQVRLVGIGKNDTTLLGINKTGHIIGIGPNYFVYHQGVFDVLGAEHHDFLQPIAINNAGQIIGYRVSNGEKQADPVLATPNTKPAGD